MARREGMDMIPMRMEWKWFWDGDVVVGHVVLVRSDEASGMSDVQAGNIGMWLFRVRSAVPPCLHASIRVALAYKTGVHGSRRLARGHIWASCFA